MEPTELRTLTLDELKGKVRNWRDELFRSRFKVQGNEARDTSVVRKLRREIARALTVLSEKQRGVVVTAKPKAEAKAPKAEKTAKTRIETPETEAAKEKPAKKKTAAKKKE